MVILVCACGVFAYTIGYIGSTLDRGNTIIAEFRYIQQIVTIYRTKTMHIK